MPELSCTQHSKERKRLKLLFTVRNRKNRRCALMAIRPRTRKRVQAVRRAADGSAFKKCEECGVMIAIALYDMHECGEKRREVKRFKYIASGNIDNISKPIGSFEDEPRSPFVFFLEEFRENYNGDLVDASRICFNDQKPFNARAMEVDSAHSRKLNEEAKTIYKADEEADSKTVGRYDKFYESYVQIEEEEDYDSSDHFGHEFWEDDTMLDY
ncbi:HMG-box (high mobility group) DNA-binding family protein [Arabidopsis thaliana]|uniref:HMG-box (High mobility group) DNA-binding family protein n=1 Tax=Arabidopsis thaliana TaxID=3702 RepID=B3H7F5_ARATH|nr:HMG-box (high mobility group) DNA-binding family protein [Arabidopsis thaliana]AED90860.2 HMG-box (high mobility group) DNA-binding family protein [Arabidopsis thaliana]|eukprot:NP_001318483.1 HMG-box (high mobility group) DNA-binding family protein [Arabidopsis thaliana]